MLRDITLGQYYPVQSPVHRMDPRVKIMLTVAFIVCVFLVGSPLGYIPIALYTALACWASNLPFKMMLRSLRPLRILLIFTFILNLFFGSGQTEIFRLWFIRVSAEGLNNAIHFSLRLVFLVMGSSVMTLTTPPVTLTDGLESLVSPLKVIKFPAHEMAMMMTIALRFIPTLAEEADKIMKAQSARGADFTSGSLRQRAKALIPLLVPLFVSAFRRAGDLAMAMESRCYRGGEGRTKLHILKAGRRDLFAALSMAALFATVLLMARYV